MRENTLFPVFFSHQSYPEMQKQDKLCSHLLRQPQYLRPTGQCDRQEKLPLCGAAASSAGPLHPLLQLLPGAQGEDFSKEGRFRASLAFVTNTLHVCKRYQLQISARFPYLLALKLFSTCRLLSLSSHTLRLRFLHHQLRKILLCVTLG